MLIKCRVKIVNNKVVCENDKKLMDKIESKKEIINEGFGYIKHKDKLKHLLDIGVDLDKYHPSILRVVCDGGRDSKLMDVIKPQLEMIAKFHKTVKNISGHVSRKYNKKKAPVMKTPIKEIKGGHLSESDDEDVDEILSGIESDIEAGELTDAETKLKTIKNKIPKKIYKKLSSTIRS